MHCIKIQGGDDGYSHSPSQEPNFSKGMRNGQNSNSNEAFEQIEASAYYWNTIFFSKFLLQERLVDEIICPYLIMGVLLATVQV